MEIKLTGILSTSLLSPGEPRPSHGILVGPGVNAAAHQHLFCARLDMAVDDQQGGKDLVVSEVGGFYRLPPSNIIGCALCFHVGLLCGFGLLRVGHVC